MIQLNKSHKILARLMSEENIEVIQTDVPTAMFDLKDRTMYIPYWNKDSEFTNNLVELMIAHEVSHAKHTPLSGLHNAKGLDGKTNIPFPIINIVEDARIERMICEEYMGLYPVFSSGYQEMWEKKVSKEILPSMIISSLFPERINFYFKFYKNDIRVIDKKSLIQNKEEEDIVNSIECAKTFEEVLDCCREVFEYTKKERKEQKKEKKEQPELPREIQEDLKEELTDLQENHKDQTQPVDWEDEEEREKDSSGLKVDNQESESVEESESNEESGSEGSSSENKESESVEESESNEESGSEGSSSENKESESVEESGSNEEEEEEDWGDYESEIERSLEEAAENASTNCSTTFTASDPLKVVGYEFFLKSPMMARA